MDALLRELCADHGWCPGADATAHLLELRSDDSGVVADAIISAEFGSEGVERRTRDWLIGLVDDWLFDPHGRGAASGLAS